MAQPAHKKELSITDDALIRLNVKDLNKLLNSLSAESRNKLKRRRRILKNRGYAAKCRTKRLSEIEILEIEKQKLESEIKQMAQENELLKSRLNTVNECFFNLQHYVKLLKTN